MFKKHKLNIPTSCKTIPVIKKPQRKMIWSELNNTRLECHKTFWRYSKFLMSLNFIHK